MSVPKEIRRDVENIYHPTTLVELKQEIPKVCFYPACQKHSWSQVRFFKLLNI